MLTTRNVIIAVIIIFLIWLLWSKRAKAGSDDNVSTNDPGCNQHIIMRWGSRGEEVKCLQRKLNELIIQATKRDIKMYCKQTMNGEPVRVGTLTVDGFMGANTTCALKALFGVAEIFADQVSGLTLQIPQGVTFIGDEIKYTG